MVQHNVRIHSMSMTQAATIVILIGSVLPRISLILVLSPYTLLGSTFSLCVMSFSLRGITEIVWPYS